MTKRIKPSAILGAAAIAWWLAALIPGGGALQMIAALGFTLAWVVAAQIAPAVRKINEITAETDRIKAQTIEESNHS